MCNLVNCLTQVNWSVLWRTWLERDIREILVLPLIVLIILVPIGLFTGMQHTSVLTATIVSCSSWQTITPRCCYSGLHQSVYTYVLYLVASCNLRVFLLWQTITPSSQHSGLHWFLRGYAVYFIYSCSNGVLSSWTDCLGQTFTPRCHCFNRHCSLYRSALCFTFRPQFLLLLMWETVAMLWQIVALFVADCCTKASQN